MPKKIMIVDDEPGIVDVISRKLTSNGFLVVTAGSSFEAIHVAHNEMPDLILLDYKLPAGSGLSAYKGLKALAATSATPIIFITAYPNEELREKVIKMGARDFIAKPFDINILLMKIKEALDE